MKSITRSTVNGRVAAPPSKSMMGRPLHRRCWQMLYLSSETRLFALTRDCTRRGQEARRVLSEGEKLAIRGTGKNLRMPRKGSIDCGESGLCMRMFTPLWRSATRKPSCPLGSLRARPMNMLEQLAKWRFLHTDQGHAPIRVRGR